MLSDCNTQKESTLDLAFRLHGRIQILVKTLTGKAIALEVESTDEASSYQGCWHYHWS